MYLHPLYVYIYKLDICSKDFKLYYPAFKSQYTCWNQCYFLFKYQCLNLCGTTLSLLAMKSYTNEHPDWLIKVNEIWYWRILNVITVRLAFLTHSVHMRPSFQGLPWFEFDGLGEDELLIRFYWVDNLKNLLWFYFQSLGTNLVQVFIAYDECSTDHSLT